MITPAPLLELADTELFGALERLKTFLRFASVTVDPELQEDSRKCREWLVEQLRLVGMEATIHDTNGHPIVMAHDNSAPADAPHLLYYGHYDVVQPDPIEAWNSPPFEPTLIEGAHGPRLIARGAVDDKGQLMTWIEALRIWKRQHGALPVRVTVLIEGEEEISSPSLAAFLRRHSDTLKADACVISDTLMIDVDVPAITVSMRGAVYVEVAVDGPNRDLHSGTFGGTVVNPIHVLARALGELHDVDGRVNIPGFYDRVEEPPADILEGWRAMNFDESALMRDIGLARSTGEAGRSFLERMASRPACDVCGIWGGFTGEGSKYVIPPRATAKVSCHLVPNQSPAEVIEGLRAFFAARIPEECRFSLKTVGGAALPIRVRSDSAFIRAAERALVDTFGRKPVLRGGAGALPVVSDLKRILDVDCVLMGFGLADDHVHAPNEKFELVCFRQGIRSHLALLFHLQDVRQ